jgi:hypothetical protein
LSHTTRIRWQLVEIAVPSPARACGKIGRPVDKCGKSLIRRRVTKVVEPAQFARRTNGAQVLSRLERTGFVRPTHHPGHNNGRGYPGIDDANHDSDQGET